MNNNFDKKVSDEMTSLMNKLGLDPNNLPTREQTKEEKEHSLFVYMCYVVSWMNPPFEITKEKWDELIQFWMVTSEITKNWIEYSITDKALEYVWWVDSDYAKKIEPYKKEKLLWIDKDSIDWNIGKTNNSVDDII